jgi:dihydrofolate reductase
MTELVIIAAIARNGIIGATVDGKATMPWRLPEDLKHFKALTLGHPIIMGRKTWESLGRPLPGRQNIVITRSSDYVADGATVVESLDAAIAACNAATAFVIGGGEIYAQALAIAAQLELTEIDAEFDGDTRFPLWDRQYFIESSRETHHAESGLNYAFVTYHRAKAPSR